MKVLARQFNIYLALAVLLGLGCGCQTGGKTLTAALRMHIETSPGPTGTSPQISVVRSDPVLVTIRRDPILTEANILQAKVINAQGGFALELKFDGTGTWLLEQYSASNPGNHFAIWAQWSENEFSPFAMGDLVNLPSLAGKLKQPTDAVSSCLKDRLSATTLEILAGYQPTNSNPVPLQTALVADLNRIIQGQSIYSTQRFAGIVLRRATQQVLARNPEGKNVLRLNRLLIEDAYPRELSRNRKKAVDSRWLAAPLISRRIGNGVLAFTADCDRNEADQLVSGLNITAKEIHKSMLK